MGRDGQVSALALFSEELRRAPSAARLTQDQLAERVGYSPSLDVAYLDNALAGQVAERAQDVARLTLLYDILKAEALSPRASSDLVRKAIETWT